MSPAKKKVLLTGAAGMLGRKVLEACPETFEVIAADLPEFDITSMDETSAFVESVGPKLLINCAAMTDVDGCESRFEDAYRINGVGAGHLARAAFEAGAEMLQVSTDYVFNGGKKAPYFEDDPVCPVSAYGRSKLAGETFVRGNNPRHWIVRTQWLYGPGGRNFVDTILKAASERDHLDVVDDQVGCPTFTRDLAAELWRIVALRPPYGIYNCSNEGACSWYGYARRIVSLAGLDRVEVRPMTSDKLNRPAKRPPHSVLDNFHLRMTIGCTMRPWEEALQEYIASRAP